jgi:hypothetical protein
VVQVAPASTGAERFIAMLNPEATKHKRTVE